MQTEQQTAAFDIEEARRTLGDVFAPWVQDLGLSVEQIESAAPAGSADYWQPGATLRMAFSERLCRQSGVVCGQALMALADTAMVIAMVAANRGCRPMTTAHEPTFRYYQIGFRCCDDARQPDVGTAPLASL